MAEGKKFRLTHDLRPAYYDDFQCIGGACRNTCCIGWTISFDKKDYLKLKQLKNSPELDKRFEGCLKRIRHNERMEKIGHYAEFRLKEDGNCPLHREDGLCALQLEHGHEALPLVCRSYPRNTWTGYYEERSLSPSCEAVLELLWNLPEGIDFRSDALPDKDSAAGTYTCEAGLSPFQPFIREQCIDILQYRGLPLSQRILLMGFFLQKLSDDITEQQMGEWISQIRAVLQSGQAAELAGALCSTDAQAESLAVSNAITMLLLCGEDSDINLNTLRGDILKDMTIFEGGQLQMKTAPYYEAKKTYQQAFADLDYFFENLAVATLFYQEVPTCTSVKTLWQSYVSFCNVMSFYRFMAVMSCRDEKKTDKAALFRALVYVGRHLLHSNQRNNELREMLEDNKSDSLAHMAILLSL